MRWPVKILIPCLMLLSCGKGNGVVNDQAPSGTVVASGSFTGLNISGTVLVYNQCNGSYALRLANFNATGGIGLQLQADTTTGGGQRINISTLGITSGNVNFSFQAPVGTGFGVVYLHSPGSNTDPGIAAMTQVSTVGC